jgi:hypothetical protein
MHPFVWRDPDGDRTHNLRLRRPLLYPIELLDQTRNILFCGCKYKKMDSKSDNLYDFNRVFALKVNHRVFNTRKLESMNAEITFYHQKF